MNEEIALLFKALTHGVYVVGVAAEGRRNAFTAAWIMQVSFDPPLLALSINPAHSSYALLREGRAFTVNVLKTGQAEAAEHFGRPASADKLAGVNWRDGRSGAPILEDALAWLDCELAGECAAGDHMIILGRVISGGLSDSGGTPMNYRETGNMDGSNAFYPNRFASA